MAADHHDRVGILAALHVAEDEPDRFEVAFEFRVHANDLVAAVVLHELVHRVPRLRNDLTREARQQRPRGALRDAQLGNRRVRNLVPALVRRADRRRFSGAGRIAGRVHQKAARRHSAHPFGHLRILVIAVGPHRPAAVSSRHRVHELEDRGDAAFRQLVVGDPRGIQRANAAARCAEPHDRNGAFQANVLGVEFRQIVLAGRIDVDEGRVTVPSPDSSRNGGPAITSHLVCRPGVPSIRSKSTWRGCSIVKLCCSGLVNPTWYCLKARGEAVALETLLHVERRLVISVGGRPGAELRRGDARYPSRWPRSARATSFLGLDFGRDRGAGRPADERAAGRDGGGRRCRLGRGRLRDRRRTDGAGDRGKKSKGEKCGTHDATMRSARQKSLPGKQK